VNLAYKGQLVFRDQKVTEDKKEKLGHSELQDLTEPLVHQVIRALQGHLEMQGNQVRLVMLDQLDLRDLLDKLDRQDPMGKMERMDYQESQVLKDRRDKLDPEGRMVRWVPLGQLAPRVRKELGVRKVLLGLEGKEDRLVILEQLVRKDLLDQLELLEQMELLER
jgi:hypothetical protein